MVIRDVGLIDKAKKKASQSVCKFQIAALGFNHRGEYVVIKTNSPRFWGRGGGLHAEIKVMREAKRFGIVKILICRIGRTGKLLPIDPCSNCQKVADKLGIKIETII